jgi:myo-inositol-1(or 4)-monophosphatase
MNLEAICKQTTFLAKETGEFIRQERSQFSSDKVEVKGLHNFVSYVDTTAEKMLVKGLQKILPQAGFIAEEGTVAEDDNPLKWIIDPLDGTTNFIHGLPPFAISIALMQEDELVLGVIYEVSLDECFYAWKGSKAYLNDKEIKVTRTDKVKDSLIATGFPYYDYDRLQMFLKSLDYFMKNSHGMRRLGSAATDLAYVACGRFESFYEYGLSPWDVAAGALIVKQAGGKVCDFNAKEDFIFGKEIIASNGFVHEEFVQIVNKIFYDKNQKI